MKRSRVALLTIGALASLLVLGFVVRDVHAAGSDWNDLIDEGNRLELLRDYGAAKRYYLNALQMARKAGTNTPHVGEAQARLAAVCMAQRNVKEAEPYMQAALKIALEEKRLGHPDEEVAICMDDLAGAYLDEAPSSNREYCYKKAIEIREKIFGLNHPSLSRTYGSLATFYMDNNRYTEAAPQITKALSITSRSVSSADYSLAKQVLHHALLKYDHGDLNAAEKMSQVSADIEKRTKTDLYQSIRSQFDAVILADRGKVQQAEQVLIKAIKHDEIHHPDSDRFADDYAQLARFYCQHHRDKEAQRFFILAKEVAAKSQSKNLEEIVSDQMRCFKHSGKVKPLLNLRLAR